MDERHWWITSKLQQSFKSSINQNEMQNKIEEFLSKEDTLTTLNDYFTTHTSNVIIFYCLENENNIVIKIATLPYGSQDSFKTAYSCVYFLKLCTEEITVENFESELYFGEINQSSLTLFYDVFRTSLNIVSTTIKDNGENSIHSFLSEMGNYLQTFNEYKDLTLMAMQVLKIPKNMLLHDFKKSRISNISQQVIAENELILCEWIQSIENVLKESLDERLDVQSGLISMLSEWKRRLKIIRSIMDQLKSKECKSVLALLLAGKSKVLKNWRSIDALLTDIFNDVKEKVKYLESFGKRFDHIQYQADLSMLTNTVMPDFVSHVRQLDTISRFYAKNGFLGSLFAKISYQLTNHCKENIKLYIDNRISSFSNNENIFWKLLSTENLKEKSEYSSMKKHFASTLSTSKHLTGVLYSGLLLCQQYKEMYFSLIDSLGGNNVLQYTPHQSGVYMLIKRLNQQANMKSNVATSTACSSVYLDDNQSQNFDHVSEIGYSAGITKLVYGIAFTDTQVIMEHVNYFTERTQQLLSMIETLKQFTVLIDMSKGLPQLSYERWLEIGLKLPDGDDQHSIEIPFLDDDDDDQDSEDELDVYESISKKLHEEVKSVKRYLKTTLTFSLFLDMEQSDDFHIIFSTYSTHVESIEKIITQYLKCIFEMNWNTQEQLNILKKFKAVLKRTGLTELCQDKYSTVLQNYQKDLELIENQYEAKKESPPTYRNLPIVSSAITWSRGLLRRIEKPMQELKAVKIVHLLNRYEGVVKYYNRIAAALIKYEEKYITAWNSQVVNCTSLLNVTLLAHEVVSKQIVVYADPRVLEIFSDVKSLNQLGVNIPKSAVELCSHEHQFKKYKQTLESVVSRYYNVYENIPDHLYSIMVQWCKATFSYFQPGLSVLKWNSLNVDAFLFKLDKAVGKFESVSMNMQEKLTTQVNTVIEDIKNVTLFHESLLGLWNTTEFLEQLKTNLSSCQVLLTELLFQVESSLKDVIRVVHEKDNKKKTSKHFLMKPSQSQEYALTLLSGEVEKQKCSSPHMLSDEIKLYDSLLNHYRSHVIDAIKTCITTSLTTFSKSLEDNKSEMKVRFKVNTCFHIPDIHFEPTFVDVVQTIASSTDEIIDLAKQLYWFDGNEKKACYHDVIEDENITNIVNNILDGNKDSSLLIEKKLDVFESFRFLWMDDMNSTYKSFEETHSDVIQHHSEVRRIVEIEESILSTDNEIELNAIVLSTTPIKDALLGFCLSWKDCYIQKIHHISQINLNEIITQREIYHSHLVCEIHTLVDLENVLMEIDKINDLNNHVDDMYLPIEAQYKLLLSEYKIPLPREEIDNVMRLRDKWSELILLGDKVLQSVMRERRTIFEQKLDKEVKEFVIEVIQFRNKFDSQGPGIPGILPSEAVYQLKEFQMKHNEFDERRKTLHAIQKIFGICATPFTELEKTGEELHLLTQLYDIFQKYIEQDQGFCETLWSDVNLEENQYKMNELFEGCSQLPSVVHNWYAYKDLCARLNDYLHLFPILQQLASKEIRNRHWLQVMHVTMKSFQLEANIFKLKHIIDIGLVEHKIAINGILKNSQAELLLENKIRKIEEEWSEQVFQFETYKGRGLIVFDKGVMGNIMDVLEDGKITLSAILSSKHVKPFHEEASSWAVKLNEMGDVIEQWKSVEELWMNLESIFTSNGVSKDLPQQFATFSKADRSYMKLVKKAVENPNVVQCCLVGDVSKMVVLKDILKDLEICFKSLASYLQQKRKIFPRFNFIPDKILLFMLSKPFDLDDILPYLKDIMLSVSNVQVHSDEVELNDKPQMSPTTYRGRGRRKTSYVQASDMCRERLSVSVQSNEGGDSRRSSRLGSIMNQNLFVETEWKAKNPNKEILAIVDEFGEKLVFTNKVVVTDVVEDWLLKLLSESKSTILKNLKKCLSNVSNSGSMDEVIMKNCCQVGFMTFLTYWTTQCEKAISDIRIDRKSFQNMNKKFLSLTNRLMHILSRGIWKSANVKINNVQKLRLESIIGNAHYLRDLFEELVTNRKIRDINDFDWKQTIKCYEASESDESIKVSVLDDSFSYQHEFVGGKLSFVMTPASDRCMMNLMLALAQHKGGCVSADSLTGKTEVIKGLSVLFGQFLFMFNCKQPISKLSLNRVFTGLCENGGFICFDNAQCFSEELLSSFHYYMKTLSHALTTKADTVQMLQSEKVTINHSCGVFITTTKAFMNHQCPVYMKEKFRIVSLLQPDVQILLRTYLISHGFKCVKELSKYIKMTAELCQKQLESKLNFSIPVLRTVIKIASTSLLGVDNSMQYTDSNLPKLSSATSSVTTFSQAASRGRQHDRVSVVPPTPSSDFLKSECSFVAQAFLEVIGARLSDQERIILISVVNSIFGTVELNEMINPKEEEMKHIIPKVLQEKNLSAQKSFVDKILQFYHLSQVHSGIVLCGASQSGKTTCTSVLLDALQLMSTQNHSNISYKYEHINVYAVSNLDMIFGSMDKQGNWTDGIFTMLMKKANQQQAVHKTSTWICFDAPLHDKWCSKLDTLIDNTKVFVQPDLRRYHLNEYIKLLFETDVLNDVSPDIIAKMGILYVDSSVVGWRALAESWLSGRPLQQVNALQRSFYKCVDRVIQFVQEESELCVYLTECSLFSSCLDMLDSLLKEHTDLGGEIHIERLFIFSLIWSIGGLLKNEGDKHQFNTLLLSITNVLPDDDYKISVFDYYVDESGEWDSWGNKLIELDSIEVPDIFGDLYIETISTIQTKFFIHLLSSCSHNLLLFGDRATGKSGLVQDYLKKEGNKKQILKQLSYSKATTCTQLQEVLEKTLVHRRGFVYGGKNNKSLKFFIDDIDLPVNDVCEHQSVNELLHQLVDRSMIYSSNKGYQLKNIEGFSLLVTMGTQNRSQVNKLSRLLGNFTILQMATPTHDQIVNTVSLMLEGYMTYDNGLSLPDTLHDQIVSASTHIYDVMRKAFNSQYHLGDLKNVFNMLQLCPEESRVDEEEGYLLLFWMHEMKRVFSDRINNLQQLHWFNQTLNETVAKIFQPIDKTEDPIFTTFGLKSHLRSQRQTKHLSKVTVSHERIAALVDTYSCFTAYLTKYTNEMGVALNLPLHQYNIALLVKIHRILSQQNGTNAILVSTETNITEDIIRLTTFMLNYHLHYVKLSNLQDLRMAVRMAGCDNKHVVVMVKTCEVKEGIFYDAINSLMTIGEYAPLLSDAELNGLLLTIMPLIKKKHSSFRHDPKRFFTKCVKKYLHFVLLSTPHDTFLNTVASDYPGIVSTSYMEWSIDSTYVQLQEDANSILCNMAYWSHLNEQTKSQITKTFIKLHSYVIEEMNGDSNIHGNEVDFSKSSTILENQMISLMKSSSSRIQFNSLSFKHLLQTFNVIVEKKMKEMIAKSKVRQQALECLQEARKQSESMQGEKMALQQQYNVVEKQVEDINNKLFVKSSLVEKLKAKLDVGTGSFRAFMSLIENEMIESDDDTMTSQEDQDELDMEYERIQFTSNHMKSLDEQIEDLKLLLVKLEEEIKIAKESLSTFQVKIDRGCIERLRAFQSPPSLVGTVMVMVMILIGRAEFANYVMKKEKKVGSSLSVYSRSSSSTRSKKSNAKSLPISSVVGGDGKVDRVLWKSIQQILQDSSKFCEHLNNYNWCEGVSDDVLYTVVSMFASGEEVPPTDRDDKKNVKPDSSQGGEGGVSLQAVKYSSEDAAQMVEYIQSVVYFTKKYLPYKKAMKRMKRLEAEKLVREKELEEMKRNDEVVLNESVDEEEDSILESLGEKDLPIMQEELNVLQAEYDSSSMKKHEMKTKLQEFTFLLNTNLSLLASLQNMKKSWSCYKEDTYLHSDLITQSIVTSSYLSISGAFNLDQRKYLLTKFFDICESNGLLCEDRTIVTQSIMEFLNGKVGSNKFALHQTCNDKVSMDLICSITCHDVMNRWPIMFDQHGIGVYMVQKAVPDLHMIKADSFHNSLEHAVQRGFNVLLLDVSLEQIESDFKLAAILKNQQQFIHATVPFKLTFGDKEIDCSPNFRLIMATTSDIDHVNWNGIASCINPILVQLPRVTLVEIFLSQFMINEKAQIEESFVEIKQELAKLMESKHELEEELILCFTSNTSFQDIVSIRKISHIKKLYEETRTYESKSEESIVTLRKSRDTYKPIAVQAACIFQVASSMRQLNPLYEISIEQFLSYFDVAVSISDRTGVSSITEKLLDAIFVVLSKSKLEEDRNIFALYTALEIEDSLGRVSIGDREFLIGPRYGALIKQPRNETDGIPAKLSLKKPFDWMSDEQYNNLLILSQNFDWFTETFEKMPKDGREMQWRQICEHETPEMLSLPDNLDERYTSLQRLLVIRAFRSDRLPQAANIFVTMTLGKRFANDSILDFKNFYHQMQASVPILLLYKHDSLFCWEILNSFAISKQTLLITYHVSGQTFEEEKLKKLVSNALQKGCWLYLTHIHCNQNIMKNLHEWIKTKKSDSTFRLWLSADMEYSFNTDFLHSCLSIVMTPPKIKLKNSVLHNLSLVPTELWRALNGTDLYNVVYNVCMLHACVIQRIMLSVPYKSSNDDIGIHIEKLLEAFQMVLSEVEKINEENSETPSIHQLANQNIKNMPWSSMRSYLTMTYSTKMERCIDLTSLSSLIDHWMCLSAVKKDFEISRAHYKHPAILFNNNLKVSSLLATIEGLPTFDYVEFTGIFQRENKSPEHVKDFMQLKHLYEKLPETSSLIHYNNSLRADDSFPSTSLRESEIMDITTNILNKLPKLWSKEFVADRIRRTGGLTTYNMWLLSEADSVCVLHHTIKSTAMKLQEILEESSSSSVIFSSDLLNVAIAIFNNKVPSLWCQRDGTSSLPDNYSITAWINDFDLRCKHIEKVLLLGRDRMPGYWLAAFFNPKRLLTVIIQDSIQNSSCFSGGDKLSYIVKTEITSRDKDHLRDPPSEGIFIYGVHLWGAHWEKATNELQDIPPKSSPYVLPVIHLQVVVRPEKPLSTYNCPCFISRTHANEQLLDIGITQKDIPATRWVLRNLLCTLRPF